MARPIVHASKESAEDPSPRFHTGGPVDGGGSRDEAFHTPIMRPNSPRRPQRFRVVYHGRHVPGQQSDLIAERLVHDTTMQGQTRLTNAVPDQRRLVREEETKKRA
jgi:hypothetical protein